MFEKIAVNLAFKIVEKIGAFLLQKVLDFVSYMQDKARLKDAMDKAKQGDNSDLEDMLNSRPPS